MSSTWNPTLVVAAVILYKGDVLIQKCDESHLGFWEFPGGKVHYNENLRKALNREVLEEIGSYMRETRVAVSNLRVNGTRN